MNARFSLLLLSLVMAECQGWTPPDPKSCESRRAWLEKSALVSAGLLLDSNPASSGASSGDSDGPDLLHKTAKIGVLWHAARQQAFPAVPKILERIVHKEWLADDGCGSSTCNGMVFIGERHDDFEHHMVQSRCIKTLRKALASTRPNVKGAMSIGVEWFQRDHQPLLDRFLVDPSYTYSQLQKDSNWDTTWGYDMLHYIPILSYAKEKGIRLYGLHPSEQQVQDVVRRGADALPGTLKDGVLAIDQKHYLDFQQTMNPSNTQSAPKSPSYMVHMDRLYLTLCFREEFMAESVALQLAKRHPREGHWTVVLAGETHVAGRGGIPSRALRRSSHMGSSHHHYPGEPRNRGVYTILARTIDFPLVANQAPDRLAADYVWFVENDTLKPNQVNPSPLRGLKA